LRDYKIETEKRTQFIRDQLKEAGAQGIVFGNSGGKDSALVGILCKLACENTVGLIMPCGSSRNYSDDISDALLVSRLYRIEARKVDLTSAAEEFKRTLREVTGLTAAAEPNIAPRMRMTALYAVSASEGRLVAGTDNRSERYIGYFTKWGDGAFDFNPISDLTVTEIYEFLKHLDAPRRIINKVPSAGLYDGQTDEAELGVSYTSIDKLLLSGKCPSEDMEIISRHHKASEHKRRMPAAYGEK